MLKLSAAYGARWASAFGSRDLRYNERLWTVVSESQSPEDMFFGLIDRSDGSSFLIRIESVEALDELDDEALESSLADSIGDPRFETEQVDRFAEQISGLGFNVVEYLIRNPKFGEQVVRHAYSRGDDEVIVLVFAWPTDLPCGASGWPVKQALLLEGLSLR